MSDKIIHTADYSTVTMRYPSTQPSTLATQPDGSTVSCYMTTQAKEYDEARDEDFGSGSYEDMCAVLSEMIKAYVGNYNHFQMVAELSVDQFKLHFSLRNREHASIFIGRKAQHLQLVFNWLRAQQIYPHNRKIQIIITKEDEEDGEQIQSFWDLNDGFWDRKTNRRK